MGTVFKDIINKQLVDALSKQGITQPTEIQQESIPLIIEGKDIIASSETGSGKTLAYLLPLFMRLDKEIKNPQAIVIAPTHELAVQVFRQVELLIKNSDNLEWIAPVLLIGGANIKRQLESIKQKPRIVIGSTGRMLEIIKMKKLTSHFVKTIVIDEADRLLESNNIQDIMALIKTTLRDRQIVMFSASIEKDTIDVAQKLMNHPIIVDKRTEHKMPKNIEHMYVVSEYRDKIKALRKIVHSEKMSKGIVFFNNPDSENIDLALQRLNYHGIKSVAAYGNVKKHDRRQALLDFREGRATLLLASDLAARGLDFKGLTHVVNFDMPEDPEIYLHRAGRCGRMGATGKCISIVTEKQKRYISGISKKLDIIVEEKNISFGKIDGVKAHKSNDNRTDKAKDIKKKN